MTRNVWNDRTLLMASILLISLLAVCAPVSGAAYIDVTSNPSGAWVCLDGWNCDTTPETFSVDPYSWHTITVSMSGYQTWRDYVGTGSDVSTTAEYANLIPNPVSVGWLDINPFDAEVWVDGIDYGNGAMSFPLSPGSHTLILRKPGYYDYSETFTINAGQTTSRAPGMTPYPQQPEYGSLQVDSDPAGAAIYLGQYYKGIEPATGAFYITDLTPGTYTLKLTMPDYQPWTQQVQVQAGIVNDIHATLSPNPPGPAPDTTGQIYAYSNPGGANVFLDNTYRGITPLTIRDIPAGSHKVTIRLTGYQDYSTVASVNGGTIINVPATLTPAQQPNPPAPAPQPTKSLLSVTAVIAAIGICGGVLLLGKKE